MIYGSNSNQRRWTVDEGPKLTLTYTFRQCTVVHSVSVYLG